MKLQHSLLLLSITLLTATNVYAKTSPETNSETVSKTPEATDFKLETKPTWELGLGAGYFSSVDYPGSKDPNIANFVLPFFIYRSEVFRLGDGGIGAVAVEEPRFKVDVSLGGALNAESELGSVRSGMPDLDLLFEFGPRLQYRLYEKQWNESSSSVLDLDTSIRAVVSTDFKGIQAEGFIFSTGLAYRQRSVAGENIDLIINADATFGDQRFNDNFYSVTQAYANTSRPTYKAKAGYVESRIFVGLGIKPTPALNIFTGVGLFSYANSANEESPLFETKSNIQYAVGLAWTPLRSKKTIDVFASD